jgi:hypothetical protein
VFLSREARERRETRAFYECVRAAFDASILANVADEDVGRDALREIFAGLDPRPAALVESIAGLIVELLDEEVCFERPKPPAAELGVEEGVVYRNRLRRLEKVLADPRAALCAWMDALYLSTRSVIDAIPPMAKGDGADLVVPLRDIANDLPQLVDGIVRTYVFGGLADKGMAEPIRDRLWANLLHASGMTPATTTNKQKPLVWPHQQKMDNEALVRTYLAGTPYLELFACPVPFHIPVRARLEHTHIIGGSGHGKTQLLQHLILRDLAALKADKGSVIVIDSQGDLIRNITHLADVRDMADRVVLIDPNDIEHPPALNLFDFGLDRLGGYAEKDREMLLNGAVALFEYMFGALLGAELTNRQQVIFRFIARLMMVVEGATLHTMREFMESPEATRPYLDRLEPVERHFFATQFYEGTYNDTRKQILARLWGVLSNRVLARMFSQPRNRVNLFEAMNRGSLILVNTAKDLLKQEGTAIMGRFFIAMIAHAAQERTSIPEAHRRATFVYIDEAQDYFDSSIEGLLNQARKYKVGLVLAHQNLGQLERGLQAAIMASTAIKLAGGVSASDASAIAREMRAEPDFLQAMRKRADCTEFACFVRNMAPTALRLTVPFGTMESCPRMSTEEQVALIALNRSRYSASAEASESQGSKVSRVGGFTVGEYEAL